MNAIFRLGGIDTTHNSLVRIINESKYDKLFVICRKSHDLSKITIPITEKYFRDFGFDCVNDTKVGYNEMKPIDKQFLDAYNPYLYTTLKLYERVKIPNVSFDEQMQAIWRHVTYWNYIINNYNIDICVLQSIPHQIFDYILYAICKINNVKVVFTYFNILYSQSYVITDIDNHEPKIKELYEKFCVKYENTKIEDIILEEKYQRAFDIQCGSDDNDKTPYYMKPLVNVNTANKQKMQPKEFTEKNSNVKKGRTLNPRIQALKNNFKEHGIINYIKDIYLPTYIKGVKYKKTCAKLKKTMEREQERYFKHWNNKQSILNLKNIKYFYFPLHMQPECTTVPMGGWFSEQLLAIKMLSKALPEDVMILIKENPKQTIKNRSIMFIDELVLLKNVKLVSRDANTYELIENCIGIASITGTALWEGVFKGKPGLMFGNYITQYAPGIAQVTTNDECRLNVAKILAGDVKINTKKLKIFLLAIQTISMPGSCDPNLNSTEDEMYALFKQALTGVNNIL